MADGTITIDILMDDGSVKKGTANLKGLEGASNKADISIKSLVASMGLVKVASAAFDILKGSLDGAITRFDTLNQYPKVMAQMGYSTEDTTKSIDVLKAGIDGLPTSLQDITKNAQSFAILTGSAEQGAKTAVALNDAFLASGASSEDAARGVQQYSQMLSTGTVDMMSWRTMQQTMPYALNETAKAFGYAGKSATNNLYAALKDGTITMEELNEKFIELDGGTTGFAETAKTATEGIGTSFTNLKSSVVNGMTTILTKFDEVIKEVTGKSIAGNLNSLKVVINSTFKAIADNMDELVPIFKQLGHASGEIIEVFKTFFSWLNSGTISADLFKSTVVALGIAVLGLSTYFKVLNTVTKIGTAIQAAFNVVMGMNPIAKVVIAVTALVGALVYWITQTESGQAVWKAFTNWLVSAWSGMVEFFQGIWKGITDAFTATVETFKNLWGSMTEFFQGIWDGIISVFTISGDFLKSLWQSTVDSFKAIWEIIGPTVMVIVDGLVDLWNNFTTTTSGIWEGIKSIAAGVWELIKAVIMGPVLILIDIITGDWTQLSKDLSMIWTSIKNAGSVIWDGIKQIISSLVQGMVNHVKILWNTGKEYLSNIWGLIKGLASSIWDGIKNVISDLAQGAINGAKNAWSTATQWASNTWNGVKSTSSNIWGGIKSTVSSLATNTLNGMKNAWSTATDIASNIWQGVKDVTEAAMNFSLFDAGKAIMDSFTEGLMNAWEATKEFVGGIGDWIREHKGPISYDRKLLIPAGNSIMEGLNEGLDKSFGDVKRNVSSMANRLSNSFDLGFDEFNLPNVSAEYALAGPSGSINPAQIINNATNNSEKTVTQYITVQATWNGKEDIQETMEQMYTQTIRDERGSF